MRHLNSFHHTIRFGIGLIVFLSLLLSGCGGGGGSSGGGSPPPPSPPAIKLPRTGQVVGYDAATVKRDDGALQIGVTWPGPRFVDNTDGTVTDNLTGLMWLKDANCMKTYYPGYDTDVTSGDGAVLWQHALMFMSSLPNSNCGGAYSDWRLPNIRELRSLLDYSRSLPMLQAFAPFLNVQTGYPGYWASTTDSASSCNMYINMGNGIHQLTCGGDAYVWPVRAGLTTAPAALPKTGQTTIYYPGDDGDYSQGVGVAWPSPRFTTNADTSIRDNLTGLLWTPNGNLMPARDINWDQDGVANDGKVTWQHALDYVAALNTQNYLGHNDWRLPNIIEYDSLENFGYANQTCNGSPCSTNEAWLNTQGFANVHSLYTYWSSTSYAGNPSSYALNYHSYALKSGNYFYVWPVRGGL
jgi:hypothetical protein